MSFYFLLRVFALCVLALLVAADSPNHAEIHGRSTIKTANKLSCIKSDVSLVKKEVSHPLEFCKFYLSDKRTRSPLPSLGVTALQNACKCIQASPPSEPTIIHGALPSSKQCSQWTKLLNGEYKHPEEAITCTRTLSVKLTYRLQMRYRILNCCFRSKGSADFNSKNPRVDQIIEHCKASHIKCF
ncbi:hypothetical protein D6C76_04156 [Aureobasidium pullulans]|nr:hypothetical protein D6C76_04156 [Aureobasidium pullulans]